MNKILIVLFALLSFTVQAESFGLGSGEKGFLNGAYHIVGNELIADSEWSITRETPPIISNIASSAINNSGATITWTTDLAATSQVEWGTTNAYGFANTTDTFMTANHSMVLNGLNPGTLYHYRVRSINAFNLETASVDNTFTTTSPPPPSGTLTGTLTTATTTANLTTEGTADWVHWGDAQLNRKVGVTSQISTYAQIGTTAPIIYGNDPRGLTWTDGTPTATGTNNKNGLYITGVGKGFQFTAPADTTQRTLVVHVGGWNSAGTLTASLSDGSAANYVNTTTSSSGQYDRNYTFTYAATSANQTILVKWVQASGTGNVTVNGAALDAPAPPPPPLAFQWGVAGHPWSPYSAIASTTLMDKVQGLGATLYRVDLDTADFVLGDSLKAAASTRNIKLLPVLYGERPAGQPTYADAFAEGQAMAAHYAGQVPVYQVSNERDVFAGAIGDGRLPTDYDPVLYNQAKEEIRGLIDGVKSADPTAKVAVNFTWLHYGFIQHLINDGVNFDIIGIDWYSDMGDIKAVQGTFNLTAYVKTQFGKPIWIMENNKRDGSLGGDQAQADYITETASAMKANTDISAYVVYELLDEPAANPEGEKHYGLMTDIATPKTAYTAYKNVINPPMSSAVNVMTFGATPNDNTDDTAAIQAAVNQVAGTNGSVYVPTGTFMINALVGVKLGSNMTFQSDGTLKAFPTNSDTYSILTMDGKSNVSIVGGTVQGERHQHLVAGDFVSGQNGEWGMCISVKNSSNVSITGTQVRECWGDGVYVKGNNFGLTMTSLVADDNRRQGMSIINVDGITVANSTFTNNKGTSPGCGIDIEPQGSTERVDHVNISNSTFNSNTCGLMLEGSQPYNVINNVSATNNTIKFNKWGLQWRNPGIGSSQSGNIVSGNTIQDSCGIPGSPGC